MSITVAGPAPPISETEPETPARRRLTGWQVSVVTCIIILIGLGLATYAAAASYESVTRLASAHNLPLPQWTPVGIDGGLFGVIILNIALTWANMPLGLLRLMSRMFAALMVAANAAGGWPDPVSVGLRVAAPVLFIVLVETAQAVLLRHHRDLGGAEGIPAVRWLLAPAPTYRLWRRMKLWRVRDYGAALGMEMSLLLATDRLAAHYDPFDWRKKAPQTLVRMLREGIFMEDALVQVAELTAGPPPGVQPEPSSSGPGDRPEPVQAGPDSGSGHRPHPGSGRRRRGRGRRRSSGSAAASEVSTAVEIMTMKAANPGMSNAKIGEALEVSGSYVGRILNKPSIPGPDQQAVNPG